MYITDNLPVTAHNSSGHQADIASLLNRILVVDDERGIRRFAEARHDEVDPLGVWTGHRWPLGGLL
jgi:hypothetical protein